MDEHPAVENKGGLPLLRDARRCTMLMLIRSRSKFMVVDSENNANASPTNGMLQILDISIY